MAVNLKKGERVFLKHKSGDVFEGDVKKVEEGVERLTIENIVSHPSCTELEGFRKFNFREILEIKKFVPDDSPNSGSVHSDEAPPNELPTVCLKIPEDQYNHIIQLQKEFRYIKACDNNFYESISVLKQSNRIGICMKDISKGRLRRGSIFAASTDTHILLFDIEVAGDKMFDKGLREVLESNDIVKVVYDCKLLSDCLFIKHLVDLQNVMDVEANDVFIVHQERGIVRKHTRSLSYLVELYLGIPNAVVDDENFQDSWIARPIEVKNQVLLAAYVSYLIPLQKSIEECVMKKMRELSEFYNNYWKKGPEIFSPGIGTKYTPYAELKELLKKSCEVRSVRRKKVEKELKNEN